MFESPTDLSMHPEKLTHRHLFIRQKIHITRPASDPHERLDLDIQISEYAKLHIY